MKRMVCLLLSFLFCLSFCFSAVRAESEPEKIPEPTLNPDAPKYDPEHPEDLSEDQLYAASAILISADSGEVISCFHYKNSDRSSRNTACG